MYKYILITDLALLLKCYFNSIYNYTGENILKDNSHLQHFLRTTDGYKNHGKHAGLSQCSAVSTLEMTLKV